MIQYNYSIVLNEPTTDNQVKFNSKDLKEILQYILHFCNSHDINCKCSINTLKNLLSYSNKYKKCRYTPPPYIISVNKILLKDYYKDTYNKIYNDIETVNKSTMTNRITKIYMKDKTTSFLNNSI